MVLRIRATLPDKGGENHAGKNEGDRVMRCMPPKRILGAFCCYAP